MEPVLKKLEVRYVGKFAKLRSSGTIDIPTYEKAVVAWNDFVLHLSVYRLYGPFEPAKFRAIAAIKIFDPIYKKRVRIVPTDPILR